MENRVQRVVERQQITVEQAKELITKTDKSRAAYYDYFTNKTWGMSSSYNFSIDISLLGIDNTVEFIKNVIERI
jgi:cytidylate kinase